MYKVILSPHAIVEYDGTNVIVRNKKTNKEKSFNATGADFLNELKTFPISIDEIIERLQSMYGDSVDTFTLNTEFLAFIDELKQLEVVEVQETTDDDDEKECHPYMGEPKTFRPLSDKIGDGDSYKNWRKGKYESNEEYLERLRKMKMTPDLAANGSVVVVAEEIRRVGIFLAILSLIICIVLGIYNVHEAITMTKERWVAFLAFITHFGIGILCYIVIRFITWLTWAILRMFANIAIEAHEINEKMK